MDFSSPSHRAFCIPQENWRRRQMAMMHHVLGRPGLPGRTDGTNGRVVPRLFHRESRRETTRLACKWADLAETGNNRSTTASKQPRMSKDSTWTYHLQNPTANSCPQPPIPNQMECRQHPSNAVQRHNSRPVGVMAPPPPFAAGGGLRKCCMLTTKIPPSPLLVLGPTLST